MKIITILFSFTVFGQLYLANAENCNLLSKSTTTLSDMTKNCSEKLREQIQMEISASIQYMMMGSFFSQDHINRLGFAKFFFNAASEERQHAYKLMQYLQMRGELKDNLRDTIKLSEIGDIKESWENGLSALNAALELEKKVTSSILTITKTCEESTTNDYHAVDYLINEFLEEQYQGQRDLAGKISELSRMQNIQGSLGEFLFDKKLIKEA